MSKVTVEMKDYKTFGKCVRVSNGEIEFYATTELGPRIIHLGKVGGENEFYADVNRKSVMRLNEFDYFKKDEVWMNYGGHRLWHAPELVPRSYLPENYPIKYELLENGVILTPPEQVKLGMQNQIEITMAENGEIKVIHRVTNTSLWEKKFAPWALTVLALGGLEILPLSQKQPRKLSNRNIILWPYAKINDKRVTWDDKYVRITTSDDPNPFKVGTNNDEGYMMYFNHNNLFIKTFDFEEDAEYPDYGCNSESYTNDDIIECESIGKLQTVGIGETVEYVENWKLILGVDVPKTNEEIDAVVNKYVK